MLRCRRSKLATLLGTSLLVLLPAATARAAEVAQYEARARGSLMSFSVHMPETGVPITVTGGALDSTALANSLPQGFATAGVFPVPAASSAHLLVPNEMPGTGQPVPPEVRSAFQGIDYTNTPNYCQAAFPPAREGLDESYCGGPAQGDKATGYTAATANGHAKSSGDFDEPLTTKTLAESRAEQITVAAAQATFRGGASQATTGLNGDGVPQAEAKASAAAIEILNGIVKLGDVVSETRIVNDGTTDGTAAHTIFSVGSATIFGVPVRVGPDGFTIPESKGPAGDPKALTDAVNKSANVQGFRINLFPAPPVSNQNGLLSAESGGIEVSYLVDKPAPARIVQRYGYTWASLTALPATASSGALSDTPVEAGSGTSTGPAQAASSESPPTATASASELTAAAPASTTVEADASFASSPTASFPSAFSSAPVRAEPAVSAGTTSEAMVPGVVMHTVGNQAVFAAKVNAFKGRTTLDFRQLRWLYLSVIGLMLGAPMVFRLDRIVARRG